MLKVELMGNLGADCEVKESNGSKFVTMRIAHTERFKKQDGTDQESTIWVDVTYNKVDSGIIPFLKAGVKIFVRGNLHLRVYSSKKDRCMKAGATIAASEIELAGGTNDAVPRQIIDPETGMIFEVTKHYWIDRDNKDLKKDQVMIFIDKQGKEYGMNKGGFVMPKPENVDTSDDNAADSKE